MIEKLNAVLSTHNACSDAVRWLDAHPAADHELLWSGCTRGDWMLWLASRLPVDDRLFAIASLACAREAVGGGDWTYEPDRLAAEAVASYIAGEPKSDAASRLRSCYNVVLYNGGNHDREMAIKSCCAVYRPMHTSAGYAADAFAAPFRDDEAAHAEAIARVLDRCADIVRSVIAFEAIEAALDAYAEPKGGRVG